MNHTSWTFLKILQSDSYLFCMASCARRLAPCVLDLRRLRRPGFFGCYVLCAALPVSETCSTFSIYLFVHSLIIILPRNLFSSYYTYLNATHRLIIECYTQCASYCWCESLIFVVTIWFFFFWIELIHVFFFLYTKILFIYRIKYFFCWPIILVGLFTSGESGKRFVWFLSCKYVFCFFNSKWTLI